MCLIAHVPALAQVDPSGPWRTWHTDHFRIHAPASAESLALRAAVEAERARALLATELVPPRGPIDLVLADNVDGSNAFASVFPSNRLTVYLTPPAGHSVLRNYDDWLRLALTHELVHLFHLDRSRGVWRVAQAVFGRLPGLFPNAYRPSWVAEGLATYYESRFTAGGRMRGGLHPQLLAAATHREWPGPGDATAASPKWPAGFRPYAWGSRFFQWQSDRYGDSVVPQFVERTAGRLWPLTISGPLKNAGGAGVGEGWRALREAWQDSLRSWPAVADGAPPEALVRGLRVEPRPSLSPDGRYLAYFHADGRHDARVVVRDLATGKEVARHRTNGGVELAWLGPDLLVAQLDFSSPVEIRSRLYQWTPGDAWRGMPRSERLTRPFTAPGGAVGAVDLAADAASLVTLVSDREGARQPVPAPHAEAWGYVAASPDGSWLAGSRHWNGQWDIVVWRPERPGEPIQVTEDVAVDDDPSWAPGGEGERVLFTSERTGVAQVYAFTVASGALEQLTNEPTGARDPVLTRDGMLIYTSVFSDGHALVRRPSPAGRPAPPSPERPTEASVSLPAAMPRQTGYAPWHSLRPHFWLPTWHNEGQSGRFGGALVAGIDAIGRTQYVAHLALATQHGGRIEGLLDVEHRRWKVLGFFASVQQSWDAASGTVRLVQGTDTVPVRVVLGQRELTLSAGGVLRWRRWRSAATARFAAEWEHDALLVDSSSQAIRLRRPAATFAGPLVAFTLQHVSQPALSISPENGGAVGAAYRRRWDTGDTLWFDEARAVAVGYLALPLPGFAHWVLAARLSAGANRGPAAPPFEVGGASGDVFEFVPGYAVGTGRRSFPLRGYPSTDGFTRAVTGAAELRIPLALVGRGIWVLPIGLDRISVSGFAEAGRARTSLSKTVVEYKDVGGELVLDLAVSYDTPLRMRLGAGVPLTTAAGATRGEPRWYVTFGSAY